MNNNIFACLAVKWNFHKYFKMVSPQLFAVVEKFVRWQMEHNYQVILDDEVPNNNFISVTSNYLQSDIFQHLSLVMLFQVSADDQFSNCH